MIYQLGPDINDLLEIRRPPPGGLRSRGAAFGKTFSEAGPYRLLTA
jgi:hypothetical protein